MSELTISYGEVAVRLLVTAALCGVIGFERETRDQSAGFRTHILLGLGAALFTLVSAYGFTEFTEAALQSGGRGMQFDPTRIAAQIVTGIGFLGAGAIIRQGTDIRGLTTAASLWAAAAIGMAVGAGYYFGAAGHYRRGRPRPLRAARATQPPRRAVHDGLRRHERSLL